MARRNRWLVFASLTIMVAIVGGIMLFSGDEQTGDSFLSLPSAGDAAEPADTRGSDATAPSTGTLSATGEQSAPAPKPKVKDRPAPPSATPPAPGEQPDAAWQEYLEDTREVVETNEPALAGAVTAVIDALVSDDADALAALIAPDEGGQDGFAADLTATYPDIVASDPGSNVNVFTDGQATIYIAYVVVRWQDAGIVSEHTIPIMLRFVDGEWRLTSLGDAGEDLQFVQTVML